MVVPTVPRAIYVAVARTPDCRTRLCKVQTRFFERPAFRARSTRSRHTRHAQTRRVGAMSAMTAGTLLRAAARSFASNKSAGLAVAAQQVRPRANDSRIGRSAAWRDIFPRSPFRASPFRAIALRRTSTRPRLPTALVRSRLTATERALLRPHRLRRDRRVVRSPRRRTSPTTSPSPSRSPSLSRRTASTPLASSWRRARRRSSRCSRKRI